MLLLFACASSSAVMPLTPRFDPPTHALVTKQLDEAKVPSVGQNSVVIAIVSALGFEARDNTFEYREPYPQLPIVNVVARAGKPGCASISAVVDGAADAGFARVVATGSFCLVGPALWSSTDFSAARAAVR